MCKSVGIRTNPYQKDDERTIHMVQDVHHMVQDMQDARIVLKQIPGSWQKGSTNRKADAGCT